MFTASWGRSRAGPTTPAASVTGTSGPPTIRSNDGFRKMREVLMASSLKRIPALGLALLLGLAGQAAAQAAPEHFRFNSGQTIQPFFDGWTRNDDGTFEFYFAYLNRNYTEELEIPVGPDNNVSPGDPDQGQPTYFYPRQHSRIFSTTVPADWGDREVVWQVTVNDETHRAVGWLQAEWEIDPNPGDNRVTADVLAANKAPMLTVTVPSTASTGTPLTLRATVTDDGIPPPRQPRTGGQGVLPTFAPQEDGPTLPLNVPQIQTRNRHRPTRTRVEEMNITWTQLRGPVGARLTSTGDDEASVSATFARPGNYIFRVRASDGPATVTEEFSISVR